MLEVKLLFVNYKNFSEHPNVNLKLVFVLSHIQSEETSVGNHQGRDGRTERGRFVHPVEKLTVVSWHF